MATNQSVLEQLLQTALSGGGLRDGQGTGGRDQSASGGPGNLGDILGSLLGGGQMTAGSGATPSRAAPGGAGGLGDILGSILGGSETVGGDAGGVEPSRGASGSQRTPADPRSSAGSLQQQAEMPQGSGMNDLIRYGGMAVIGALAYQAYKRYQGQQGSDQELPGQKPAEAAMVPPPDSGFHPGQARGGADALSGVLVKAMVGATQADGMIDEDEQRRLVGRLDQLGVSSTDRRALVRTADDSGGPSRDCERRHLTRSGTSDLRGVRTGGGRRHTRGAKLSRRTGKSPRHRTGAKGAG